LGAEDQESIRALNVAIDRGLNFIDTALGYGNGHSERLVGQVVRSRSERIYVATKVPPKNRIWPAPPGVPAEDAFPADHVIACAEESLRNLGLDSVDVLQFHVWSDEWVGHGDWLDGVQRLKEQGKIRFFGISINDQQPANALKLIETGHLDTVQVIYNIFEQSPEDQLLPSCQEHRVGVIARVPLDEGGLTGTITPESVFPEGDFRNNYFRGERKREVYERVQHIVSDLGITPAQLPEVAMRYVLSHPAVSTIIPGMRTVRHAESNTALGDGQVLPSEQVRRLKAHRWVRSYYKP
jgi:aryl-alcohol dehydrogenase-like predicted oxidoreductase